MSQRLALFFSIGLTAFTLVVVGAAIGIGRPVQAVAVSPTLDPQLLAQLQAREAAYQAMIADANAQLQAPTPTAAPTDLPTVTSTPEPKYPISPELAVHIALKSAPNAYLLKPPELVLFRNSIAYEVTLSTGKVYVDANNGAILWNGAVRITTGGGSGFSDDDDERDDD
jgi:uncharacterized membrane protein YkoI